MTRTPALIEKSNSVKETTVITKGPHALAATALALVTLAIAGVSGAHAVPALDVTIENDGSEVQQLTVRASGGEFRLKFGEGGPGTAVTSDLPRNATADQVRNALNALTNISAGGGSVTVVSTYQNDVITHYRITFGGGALAGVDVPYLQALNGTSPLTGPFPAKTLVDTIDTPGFHRNDQRVNYTVRVRNAASGSAQQGTTLQCQRGTWTGTPAPHEYEYQWLRNGAPIAGAASGPTPATQTSFSYTVQAADVGTALQCVVTGRNTTNGSTAASSVTAPTVVSPAPATVPPGPIDPVTGSRPTITPGTPVQAPVGALLTCTPPTNWDGSPTYSFQWLRNGQAISGETNATYTVAAGDAGTVLQCQVTATNAGGSARAVSNNRVVAVLPAANAPTNTAANRPTIPNDDPTSGPVTVEVELPDGLDTKIVYVFGSRPDLPINGWACTAQTAVGLTPAKATCTRSDVLQPQQDYPPIGLGVALGGDAPDTAVATATVSGGNAPASVSGVDEFQFEPAVPFGITPGSLMTEVLDLAGDEFVQAGGHPHAVRAAVSFNHRREAAGAESSVPPGTDPSPFRQVRYVENAPVKASRQIKVDTPSGFIGNPLAAPVLCDDAQLAITGDCPSASVVGEAFLRGAGLGQIDIGQIPNAQGLIAIEPERGVAAQFAFGEDATKAVYVINARLRPEDGYAVSLDTAPVPEDPGLTGVGAVFCSYGATSVKSGTDLQVTGCKEPGDPGAFDSPFFTMPTTCSGEPLQTRMAIDAWLDPGVFDSEVIDEPSIEGCEDVPFTPSVAMSPTSDTADSPSGLDASIDVPSDGLLDPEGIAQSHLKKTVVELPSGVSVNPSAASGLGACTDAQLGLGTDSEPGCPDSSKLGTVTATTPVLEETLSGVLVLRTPESTDPTSGGMFRVALIVRNDERGILVKLPGSAVADPQTGRLTATFDDNPQLPIGHVEVHLRGGDKGVLAMGRDCGEVSTKATLTPWSGNADAISDTPLDVDQRCADGFAPKLAAGNSDNRARGQGGTYSFGFSREDGEQWLRGLTAKLPKGLLASVKDVPLCSNQLADAGNCPAASKIGVVDAKAGSGNPFVLEEKGEVFLTEGYKGGEYGLAVKIRPVAGPFRGQYELSPIVVRQAIHVDRTTAEVTAVSDPFPLIHHGIPLRVREVNVLVNRGGFMVNPSDCERKQSSATLLSDKGASAGFSDPFQVSGCAALPFKPKLTLALTGKRQVTTGKHPGIKALVTQQGTSEAGIEKAVVRLPKSLALDPENAQALCEFADGTKPDLENRCPKGSIVGRARAKTPLLKDDLVGNVYFVKNVRKDPVTGNEIRTLPMIVVALRGEIAINLRGESSTTPGGKLVNTFASVPDAPISQFNLNIQGGPNGIIAVTRTRKAKINLCTGRHIAENDMDGHNGRRHDTDVRMKTPCTKKQTKAAKRAAKRASNRR